VPNRVSIAIVDSGVQLDHPAFAAAPPVLLDVSGADTNEWTGHGTAVYNIIRRARDIADIINFRLVSDDEGVEETVLLEVLRTIDRDYPVDIVNLSLGLSMCEYPERLLEVCASLSRKGTILISAFDNAGAFSYPAAFENVIGVTAGRDCLRVDDFEYIDDRIVNIGAKGGIQRLAWDKPDYIMLGGNSFACAHVTVQTALFMDKGIRGFDAILEAFKGKAIRRYAFAAAPFSQNRGQRKPEIKKAVLFPFFKEMHSLIRFSDILDFEIVGVYDSKYSANVGAAASHIMKDTVQSLVIKNIDHIEWDMFDTLIIGHLDEMSALINKAELREHLIRGAITHNKQVYCFDDISASIDHKDVYCPAVRPEDVPPNRFGKLYRVAKPVLGIYGTSSRQGKFTLQLILRKKLMDRGYRVGQIGTEPTALLFGMDYVYPMGYNSSVYIKGYDVILYVNHLMQRLSEKGCEIILTGSQSGTVPYDTGNLVQYTLPQQELLLGTQPDAVILCINPYDETEYIGRAIRYLESLVDCTVIALVVFPMDIQDGWSGLYGRKTPLSAEKYSTLRETLRTVFTVPVYKLGEAADMEQLVGEVTGFFEEAPDENG
jgi:uncharacterized NAD-dependent epimerase/dehydratase family protein